MQDISVVAVVPETVAGVRQAPSLATDALIVFDYSITPVEGQTGERSIDLPYPGARPDIDTGVHAIHEFSVELTGAGTAIGVPHWARLLRGAMFGAAVPTVSDCGMPLISTGDGGALSLDGWKDKAKHEAFGMRGNAVFTFTEKALPSIRMRLLGLLPNDMTPMVSAVPGAVTLPVYPGPVEVNLNNTVIMLDGVTLGVRSLTLDLGMQAEFYSTTGSRSIIFGKSSSADRRGIGGTLVAELPDPAIKNYFPASRARTVMPFTLTHGTAVGNIIEIASTRFIPGRITYSVESNRIFMNMPFRLVPSAANNELTLVTK